MTPRQITDRIAQRVARTAVIGALALGLAAPMLTPSAALAATASGSVAGTFRPALQMVDNAPAPGPSDGADIGPIPDERALAEALAQSLTGDLADYLTKPAWVEDGHDFFRVVLPLKGRPELANAQFPPPSEDTLAWIDLYRYDDPSAVPAGLPRWSRQGMQDDKTFILELLPGDPVYVVARDGYDWYTLGGFTVRALDKIRGQVGSDGR